MPIVEEDQESEMITEYELAYQSLCENNVQASELFSELAARHPEDTLINLHKKRVKSGEINDKLVIRRK